MGVGVAGSKTVVAGKVASGIHFVAVRQMPKHDVKSMIITILVVDTYVAQDSYGEACGLV